MEEFRQVGLIAKTRHLQRWVAKNGEEETMSIFQKLHLRIISGAFVIAFFATSAISQASAVTINWSGSALIGDGTSDISTAGVLVEAHNGGAASAFTAGGVLFDGLEPNILGLNFVGANPLNITGDTDFDNLLNSGTFGNNAVHQIDGLTNGNNYLLQYFVTDNRGSVCGADCGSRTVTVDDGDLGTHTSPGIGDGYAFTGLFTATGVTQDVTFSGDVTGYINAWQLRDVSAVPVPAALPLFASAIIGLGLIARAKKKSAS